MFELYDELETEVEIEGTTYQLNMSFDNIKKLLDLLGESTLTDGEKLYYGLLRLLGTELDLEIEKQVTVFQFLIENFVHGEDKQEIPVDLEGNVMPAAPLPINYDLTHDARYIYTSFKQAYGIDLRDERGKLDWRDFKLLLCDLPDDTKFKQVIDIRSRPYPKGKGMGEERRKLKELKRMFALPNATFDE